MAARFCYNCGATLEDGAKFCSSCGRPVNANKENTTAAVELRKPSDAAPAEQPKANLADEAERVFNETVYGSGAPVGGSGFPESGIKQQFFTSDGRLNRMRYFKRTVVINLIGMIAMAIFGQESFLSSLVQLVVAVSAVMLSIRRLHDLNRSGWWTLFGYGVIIGVIIFSLFSGSLAAAGALVFGGILLILAFSIYLWFWRGTIGPNDYGPDPLG